MSILSKTCTSTAIASLIALATGLTLPGFASAAVTGASAPAHLLQSGVLGADDSAAIGKKQKQKRKHTGTDDGANHT